MLNNILWFSLLFFILIGVPIGYSMFFVSICLIFSSTNTNSMVIAQKAVGGLDSFTILAIPFFMIAAAVMSETGVGHKIFDFAASLVRSWRGGMGHVNILTSVIMAGMSGSAISDVTGVGKLEIEAMERAGFDRPFSAAVTAASATIGPIIPPSISMVLYGSISGVSIGRLLIGGAIPGFLMAACMMTVVYIISLRRKYPREQRATLGEILHTFWYSIPALLMPAILLGGMIGGFMTPTESACMAVVYAIFLGMAFYRNLSFKKLTRIFEDCGGLCAATMFIISSAAIFGLVLTTQQIPQKLTHFFINLSENRNIILLAINILLLVLGCVMESTSIFIILTPILSVLARPLGLDPVHFGVMVVFNVTIGLLTPPVGMLMFLTCRVANIKSSLFVKEVMPFLTCLFLALMLITYVPAFSTWLPNLLVN